MLAIRSRDLEGISIALTIRSLDRSYRGNCYRSGISIRIFYRTGFTIGISYGISIALVNHSLDPSLISRLIIIPSLNLNRSFDLS